MNRDIRDHFRAARVHALGIRDAELLIQLEMIDGETGTRTELGERGSASGINEQRVSRLRAERKGIELQRAAIVEILERLSVEEEEEVQ